ncbi:MAG: FG-GAP-like repeat-containing protein [Firmicutes bacterium]|nr:FG-GAP-like repeat-containing protein [Bacillota bacterium]
MQGRSIPNYPSNPFVIKMEIPAPQDSAGGLIVADLDADGRMDYLVTVPRHVAAYRWDGRKLWVLKVDVRVGGSAESEGLPGHHGAGVQAGDIDGDKRTEVLFLDNNSTLHVVGGSSGKTLWTVKIPVPEGAERWEHLALANLRGKGDRDLVLQATNAKGYRMGRYVAAFALESLRKGEVQPLWQVDNFLACAHNGLRVADVNGDGRDEILSGCILAPDGKELFRLNDLRGHIDSVFIADVQPDRKGLEVVALEEGANRVFLFHAEGLIWAVDHKRQEPQNAAIGRFDPTRKGLQIWCRSRYDTHQKPWVLDADGKVIADYELSKVAPADWTEKGIEVIHAIHWDGTGRQHLAAKERHESGDVAVIDAMTGRFIARFPERADRLYVADVVGDWREELIVLAGSELHIYQNTAPNPNPNRPRLWTNPVYRRTKAVWNYYSP